MTAGIGLEVYPPEQVTAVSTRVRLTARTATRGKFTSARFQRAYACCITVTTACVSVLNICGLALKPTTVRTWRVKDARKFRHFGAKVTGSQNSPNPPCEIFALPASWALRLPPNTTSAHPSYHSSACAKPGLTSSEIAAKRMAQGVLL